MAVSAEKQPSDPATTADPAAYHVQRSNPRWACEYPTEVAARPCAARSEASELWREAVIAGHDDPGSEHVGMVCGSTTSTMLSPAIVVWMQPSATSDSPLMLPWSIVYPSSVEIFRLDDAEKRTPVEHWQVSSNGQGIHAVPGVLSSPGRLVVVVTGPDKNGAIQDYLFPIVVLPRDAGPPIAPTPLGADATADQKALAAAVALTKDRPECQQIDQAGCGEWRLEGFQRILRLRQSGDNAVAGTATEVANLFS